MASVASSSQAPFDPAKNNAPLQQQQPRPLQMGAKGAYIVRLLMVGDSSCGKTSLVLRFDQNVFSTKFVTTIGVDYRDKMVKVRFFLLLCRRRPCHDFRCILRQSPNA